ncbi:MAG: NADAR family protein [Alcaligenaceae bacterium]|nr:MAG: NADAR family protein [Alcaligenaceae bacterium]
MIDIDLSTKTYKRSESIVFLKVKEAFGDLSNMAPGYPIKINGTHILTSEALYQACRYPHLPDIQKAIIGEASPMAAKMKSKPHRKTSSRSDWEEQKIVIMEWCLRVKLAMNRTEFSRFLLATKEKPIVEQSAKDPFWGALVVDDDTLMGQNVLGQLLVGLREETKAGNVEHGFVEPLPIPNFALYEQPIPRLGFRSSLAV